MVTAVLPRRPEPRPHGDTPDEGGGGHRATLVRLVRYTGVSAIATATSLSVLFALVGFVGLPGAWSNVVATAVGTVPSFELNRRWVWRCPDRRSLLGQVVPFTALSFAGLLVSTVAVGLASHRTQGWGHWAHTLAVEFANLAAFGSLWVVQYVVLDRLLFRTREARRAPLAQPSSPGRQRALPSLVGPRASAPGNPHSITEPGRTQAGSTRSRANVRSPTRITDSRSASTRGALKYGATATGPRFTDGP